MVEILLILEDVHCSYVFSVQKHQTLITQ